MSRVYHLSHIDLDGYGCQYLSSEAFENLKCYNANYGPEVMARLEEIFKDIQKEREEIGKDDSKELILITDLNLTTKEGNWLEKQAIENGVAIQLLDHHATGANAADRFAWYYLDTKRCATSITYDWLKEYYDYDKESKHQKVVKAIEAIDIWIEDSPYFEYGKVMLGMISGAREINRILFPKEDREFKLNLISVAEEVLNTHTIEEAPIALDDILHSSKKRFFILDKNDTKDNLVADYVTQLLTKDRDRMTITYRGYKGLLGYNVGSASLIGNAFLVNNEDYDFYMDVNQRGNFSLRSNNKLDVSKMAEEIGKGGGHPNASGGKIENYKDSFVYEDLKEFIQNYIDSKTGN